MSAQHRRWIFSWNKAPIPVEDGPRHSPKYKPAPPPTGLVMPYMYDMEKGIWWRWADLNGMWLGEYFPAGAPYKKAAIELLLLKG